MMIEQRKILRGKYNFKEELGREGNQRKFSLDDFDGSYTIRYRFMSKSKEMEIANIAIASAAKSIGMPDEVIVRDILLSENPDEILSKINAQKAERAEPWIMLVRLGHSAIDEAEHLSEDKADAKLLEARGLFERAVSLINPPPMAETQPTPQPTFEEPKGNANLLLPLLGAAGRGGNGSKSKVEGG